MTAKTWRDAFVGLVYLVLIAALILLSIAVYNHDFTSYTTVALRTDNVGSSLQKGSDVKVRGVEVGEVHSISTDGHGATIELQLTPSKAHQLPANMQAQLLPKTLFGERYVSLEFPRHPSSQHLSSGDVIQQNRSRSSVELEQLFADLLPVLRGVQPQKLSATLGELALALRGRGTALGSTITLVGHYLTKLAPHVPRLTDDLSAFAATANTYADAVPDLVSGLDSLSTTSQVFASQHSDYRDLLRSLTAVSNTSDWFVRTNQSQIIGLSADSLPSLKIAARFSSEFPCLSRALVDYIPTADKAFGTGTSQEGAHVILHVIPKGSSSSPSALRARGGVCPYDPKPTLSSTALSAVPGATGAHSAQPDGTSSTIGMGPANSPQENALIAQLVAPSAHVQARHFPRWGSLVLGPALRGVKVSLR